MFNQGVFNLQSKCYQVIRTGHFKFVLYSSGHNIINEFVYTLKKESI